tara:strand:- start:1685 stop:2068 length:384 start_codon:yes stop_codon:yes gene_type:complete
MVTVDVDVVRIAACIGEPSVRIRCGDDQDRDCAQRIGKQARLDEGEVPQELERGLASSRLIAMLSSYDKEYWPRRNLIIGRWLRMGYPNKVDRAALDRSPDFGNTDSVGFGIDRGQEREFFLMGREP